VQTHSTTLQGAEGGSRFTFSQKETLRKANRSGAGSRPTDLDKTQSMKRFSNTSTIPLALIAFLSLSTLNEAHANWLEDAVQWIYEHTAPEYSRQAPDPSGAAPASDAPASKPTGSPDAEPKPTRSPSPDAGAH